MSTKSNFSEPGDPDSPSGDDVDTAQVNQRNNIPWYHQWKLYRQELSIAPGDKILEKTTRNFYAL